MKKFSLCILACFAIFGLQAAELVWTTDLPKAQAQAKAENKMLLVDFTGSDWCPPCMALKKTVFSSAEFAAFAKTNLILVEVDFPRHKKLSPALQKANEGLAEKFKAEAFPTILVFDSKGKQLLHDSGYDGSSGKAFVAKLQRLTSK